MVLLPVRQTPSRCFQNSRKGPLRGVGITTRSKRNLGCSGVTTCWITALMMNGLELNFWPLPPDHLTVKSPCGRWNARYKLTGHEKSGFKVITRQTGVGINARVSPTGGGGSATAGDCDSGHSRLSWLAYLGQSATPLYAWNLSVYGMKWLPDKKFKPTTMACDSNLIDSTQPSHLKPGELCMSCVSNLDNGD